MLILTMEHCFSSPTASAVKPSPNNTSAPKPKAGSYQKLMKELRKHFQTKTE
jgi:hypothetical protein